MVSCIIAAGHGRKKNSSKNGGFVFLYFENKGEDCKDNISGAQQKEMENEKELENRSDRGR